ncbi:relaxase/mobilization nuclease domain-containing protein, partial [Escherichia coli]
MKKIKKSSFSGLADYITNPQSKQERVGVIKATNCQSQDVQDAVTEVNITQRLNTRSESDKTYHLVISFRPGEKPSEDVLNAIEESICQSLGFGDHQRLSAVHHDTDNLHIHVA